MPRIRIDGYPIGCPAVHGEGNCPFCGGGWPGTKSPSESLVKAAQELKLNPDNLGCGTLVEQGKFLVNHFFWNGKGAKMTNLEFEDESSYGVGPVGGGVFGQALINLIPEDSSRVQLKAKPTKTELLQLAELPVGPVVILADNVK